MKVYSTLAITLGIGYSCVVDAAAQSLSFVPFHINGATNIEITGVNDSGIAVGAYWSANSAVPSGFVGHAGRVTTLPSPPIPGYKAVPLPTSINSQGYVVGTYVAGSFQGFVWYAGKYVFDFSLGRQLSALPPPIITSGNTIGYNYYQAPGVSYLYEGKINSTRPVNVGDFAVLKSINSKNEVSGEFDWLIGRAPVSAVFLARGSKVEILQPPGAKSSFGGFLNEQGQVAGSLIDQGGTARGFLYTKGVYQSFDMPLASLQMSVEGIDTKGTVVGTYMDAAARHGFIFQSGITKTFGTWSLAEDVHLKLSPLGVWIALTVQSVTSNSSSAFLAKCGC